MQEAPFEAVVARRIAEGLPVGSRHTRPSLFADLRPVWNAFGVLSGRRQRGPHGVQPLEVAEIRSAAEVLLGGDAAALSEWCVLLAAMDDEFMRFADQSVVTERARRRAK